MVTQKQLAEAVIVRLREAGHEALLAGGCVRDLLLGRPPKDYDVATSARPEQVQALFEKTIAVGAAFGVVVVIEGPLEVEVATFRSDADYTDGRRPDHVTFTDARHDALRRDFTINGLFLDPQSGEVIDHVGGRNDLEGRIIRAIGRPRDRFGEDHLRMLRAVRFSAELGFEIESGTAAAVRELAPKVALVSGERVAAELERILTALPAGRRRGLELMDSLGLMKVLLPEIDAMHGTMQGLPHHPEGDVFTHTILCVEYLREPTFELAMAGLLHDLGKPPTAAVRDGRRTFYGHERVGEETARQICNRLRLSTLQTRRVTWLVRSHMKLMCCDEMREARLKRLFAEDGFEELAELWRADCLASGGTAEAYEALMARYRAMGREEVKPAPLVTGNDLIRMGLAPGPLFRQVLEQVYDAQLEGRATSKEEAVALVRRILDEQ
ncbi:MAG: CCA tRNA nucleotidyltransferase [Planctomycetota bacterium]|nr:CCA tRNA nucleotidyltransferase [Planctomycetota bacterium]